MNNMARELREIDQLKPLIEYFKKNIKKGYEIEDLKWALIAQGNSRVAVEKAMKYVTELQEAQKKKEIPVKTEIQTPIVVQPEEKKSFWQRIKSWFKRENT